MWIARDKNGNLRWFEIKPGRDWGSYEDYRNNELTVWKDEIIEDNEHIIKMNLFPNLKWDDEPVECLMKVGIYKNDEMNPVVVINNWNEFFEYFESVESVCVTDDEYYFRDVIRDKELNSCKVVSNLMHIEILKKKIESVGCYKKRLAELINKEIICG